MRGICRSGGRRTKVASHALISVTCHIDESLGPEFCIAAPLFKTKSDRDDGLTDGLKHWWADWVIQRSASLFRPLRFQTVLYLARLPLKQRGELMGWRTDWWTDSWWCHCWVIYRLCVIFRPFIRWNWNFAWRSPLKANVMASWVGVLTVCPAASCIEICAFSVTWDSFFHTSSLCHQIFASQFPIWKLRVMAQWPDMLVVDARCS